MWFLSHMQVVQEEDRLIMSEEGASSMGDCYNPTYHLSDSYTFMLYRNVSSAKHYHGLNKDKQPQFFHGNTLVNWGIFVSPRHPIFKRVLENVLEIITSTYLRESVVHISRWDVKFKQLLCTTNFVMTYTIREVELENNLPAVYLPRICENNFQQYKGERPAYEPLLV